MEVILLIGLAVGVDYSLFYMRREREERAAGRSERAALEAAAATSGRAVLVSGMTVLIAMAGMFLSGDKTFMSFSVGAMIVVAVAMIGSLTVLPAVLVEARRPRREGPHPVRRPPARRVGEARACGAPSSTASCAARSLSAVSRPEPCSWPWPLPTLSSTPTQTGMDGITSPAVEPFKRLIKAFPGTPDPAVVAIKADDVNAAPVQKAIAELKQQALASGEMHAPINVEINRDGTVAQDRRSRSPETASTRRRPRRSRPCATTSCRRRWASVDGVEYAVTGATANS